MPLSEKHRTALDLYNSGELDESDRIITEALQESETGELWNDWAVIQVALGRQEMARAGFKRAIELDPQSANAQQNLAAVNLHRADVRPASQPEAALIAAYRQFGMAALDLRRTAYRLVEMFPQNDQARFFLAEVLEASGHSDAALAEYETLQKTVPVGQQKKVEQGIARCQGDYSYFPSEFQNRLRTKEYAYIRGADFEVADDAGRREREREIMAQSWRNYGRRDIHRGREIARIVRERIPLNGRRVLDVGCGYGGALIAFAEQGADVVGAEIDEDRYRVGKKRLEDLGIPADYHLEDICAPNTAGQLGTFDVIVAQDVLEHVLDPMQAIGTLSLLLRRGGVIYAQVGNKYSFDQLQADHHYRLAGITLLARDQATEYFCSATGLGAQSYGVGYWRTEGYYRRAFAKFGVQLDHLDQPASRNHVLWYSKMAADTCRRMSREIYPGLRPELQRRMLRRISAVTGYFFRAKCRILESDSDPQLVATLAAEAVKRVCTPVWRFIGFKPSLKTIALANMAQSTNSAAKAPEPAVS